MYLYLVTIVVNSVPCDMLVYANNDIQASHVAIMESYPQLAVHYNDELFQAIDSSIQCDLIQESENK